MKAHRRLWVLGLLVVAGTAATLVGGAAQSAASETELCSQGRPFCVKISDIDGRSYSDTSAHYMKYTVTISRKADGGTSKLTNGTLTLTLEDIIGGTISGGTVTGGTPQPSTAIFQPSPASDARCSVGSASNIVTCTVPNLPAGASPVVYDPLIFKTSTTTTATGTRMTAEARFKEKGSDNQPSDPNQDTVKVSETTTYEPDPDLDLSWVYPNANLNLQTSSDDDQFSSLPFVAPGSVTPGTATLQEGPVAGSFCPNCFGEIVSILSTAGTYSVTNPVELLITWNFKPSSFNTNTPVQHDPDGPTPPETITQNCVFDPGEDTPNNLPCRDIEITSLGGSEFEVTIHVFSDDNGGWGVG